MSAPTLPSEPELVAPLSEGRKGSRPAQPGVSRGGLFRKYALALMLLVGGTLLVSGAVELALSYREAFAATSLLQRAEVRTAALRIEQYLDSIQAQVYDVSNLPWGSGILDAKDRREEFHRLMKLVPAVAQVTSIDAQGRERVRVSRIELDELNSLRDAALDENVVQARIRGRFYSPTYFKEGSEPYLTLAVRDKEVDNAVTLAEVNLKFVAEMVSQIRVGRAGIVYAVDSADHVVAHPNLSLVLRKTDLSGYAPVRRLRREAQGGREPAGMIEAEGLQGEAVMLSAAYIAAPGWLVIVEQPRAEVLAPVYASMTHTIAIIFGGLIAALAVGYALARRLAQPILEVRRGAEKIARGDLSTRIEVKTGDEVEALARQFNVMADQLQDYTTGLERKVAEKTAQLELANRHKSEFLANMSHELRTPLNAIIGFSEVMKERMFGDLNAKQMEYARDIHGSGQHLLSLINDILDLSKVEAGRMELDVGEFDVRAAVENCCTLVRERAMRHRLKLAVNVDTELGSWPADERKFKQVLINLLTNAVKFTPAGGEIALDLRARGDWLEVKVTDTGVGIAPADQKDIFNEFHQLPGAPESKQEGTGLGLALSRRLVELHGGTLQVCSIPGEGSTFTARFPRWPGAPARG